MTKFFFCREARCQTFPGCSHTVVDGTNSCRNLDVHIIRMCMFNSSLFTHLPEGVTTSQIIIVALFFPKSYLEIYFTL